MKMTKPRLLLLGVLILTSIASSSCSCFSRSPECPLRGATYGGRLVLIDDAGVSSGFFPSFAHERRMVIFQRPPGHLLPHGGFGIGQIWIGTGSRSCQGPETQVPEQCPWTGDRPCIDAGIPCETDPPTYGHPDPLEFSGETDNSITVSFPAWDETTDRGNGPVTAYKILYRPRGGGSFQEHMVTEVDGNRKSRSIGGLTAGTKYQFQIVLVRDGEPPEGPPSRIQMGQTLCGEPRPVELTFNHSTNIKKGKARLLVNLHLPKLTASCNISEHDLILEQIDLDNCETPPSGPYVRTEEAKRQKRFNNLDPNSLFNVTYRATNPAGTFNTTETVRTAELAPKAKPTILKSKKKGNAKTIKWKPPPCGDRNGRITYYNFFVSRRGQQVQSGRKNADEQLKYTITSLSKGEEWTFEVQACNQVKGCGPKAMVTN